VAATLRLDEAAAIVDAWLQRRVARVLCPGEDHHERVLDFLRRAGATTGNLVTDGQIAALAVAHRAEVHTADQDFRRFDGVRCRFPLS
jgi:predicted nucleic acid-binding protein